jgi:hypothetical protein
LYYTKYNIGVSLILHDKRVWCSIYLSPRCTMKLNGRSRIWALPIHYIQLLVIMECDLPRFSENQRQISHLGVKFP